MYVCVCMHIWVMCTKLMMYHCMRGERFPKPALKWSRLFWKNLIFLRRAAHSFQMSIRLTPRPRLPSFQVCPRHTFSRGIRLPKKSVGDDVNVWLKGPGSVYEYPINGPNWLSGNKTFVSRHLPLSYMRKVQSKSNVPPFMPAFPYEPFI